MNILIYGINGKMFLIVNELTLLLPLKSNFKTLLKFT
jgi:hypothetical protein